MKFKHLTDNEILKIIDEGSIFRKITEFNNHTPDTELELSYKYNEYYVLVFCSKYRIGFKNKTANTKMASVFDFCAPLGWISISDSIMNLFKYFDKLKNKEKNIDNWSYTFTNEEFCELIRYVEKLNDLQIFE